MTLKGRNIWVSIMVQSILDIKRIYEDCYKEIIFYCDSMLYFGSVNKETQMFVRECFDIKEQVDLRPMMCLVARKKTYSFPDPYDIAKHKFYRFTACYDKNNTFQLKNTLKNRRFNRIDVLRF